MIIDLNLIDEGEFPSLQDGKYCFEIRNLKTKPLKNPNHGHGLELEVIVIGGDYDQSVAFFSYDCFNIESAFVSRTALIQLKKLGNAIGVSKINLDKTGQQELVGKRFIGLVEAGEGSGNLKEYFPVSTDF